MRGFLLFAISFWLIFTSLGQSSSSTNRALRCSDSGYVNNPSYTETDKPQALINTDEMQRTHAGNQEIIAGSRESWIKAQVAALTDRDALPEAGTIKPETIELENFYQVSYRLTGTGYIHFENGDWIYLVSHSSHNDEKIGDITLAMDNKNRFYINEGHVCGGIIHFTIREVIKSPDSELFFRYFKGDEAETAWQALSIE